MVFFNLAPGLPFYLIFKARGFETSENGTWICNNPFVNSASDWLMLNLDEIL